MNRRAFIMGIGALATVSAASAETILRSGEPIAFNYIDSDRNGYVSRVEARSIAPVETRFDGADVNRDGLLDRDEYFAISAGEVGD